MKRDAIQRVRLHNPHVQMVAVMDATGAVDGSDTLDKWVEAATALVRPFRELAERTSVELGCGGLKTTLIEGQDATLALADVDGDRTVVVVGTLDAPGGALLEDARLIARELSTAGG